ncbi:hypothetical protein ElyMa_002511700 [Elysia marginata]|uniref:G-protein coupled receptors family 1 profile domain-containing protein n=1 Tax=Elysia marginata TaxID=1093978 RepID=A0AAV4GQP5_9GAST|nr:hypothetical protein ElyMa_002511700 [Elysia marginata]
MDVGLFVPASTQTKCSAVYAIYAALATQRARAAVFNISLWTSMLFLFCLSPPIFCPLLLYYLERPATLSGATPPAFFCLFIYKKRPALFAEKRRLWANATQCPPKYTTVALAGLRC